MEKLKNSGVQVRKDSSQIPRPENEVDDKEPQGERCREDHATPDERQFRQLNPEHSREHGPVPHNGGDIQPPTAVKPQRKVRNLRDRRARDLVTLLTTPRLKGRPLELVIRPRGSSASQPHLRSYTGGETCHTSESPESLQA